MNRFFVSTAFLALFGAFGLGIAACGSDEVTPPTPTGMAASGGAGGMSGTGGMNGTGGSGGQMPDLSEAVFAPDHLMDVQIEISPADWESLRFEGRSLTDVLGPGCMDGPKPSPYIYYPAKVTVDGEVMDTSAVRKKGFLGSASITKPSLKISFDEFIPGREYMGLEGLTLNNSRQDPSYIKTCLAFKSFRDAGLPASRCNYAKVTVNGNYLGIYANVEPVSKRMLARHFTDNTGNLYEGQLSDFRAGWSATYEKKTNELDPDRSDIDAVVNALGASDANLDSELGKVLDIDAFMKYWSMEILIAAWDGYANNWNNHLVYHDPVSNKMHFLPWGPDMSFDAADPFGPPDRPQSVSAKSNIPNRLHKVAAMKTRYADAMKEHLNKNWDETAILAEIDRVQALLAPHLLPMEANAAANQTNQIRAFVQNREAQILAELNPVAPVWPYPQPATVCLSVIGHMSGTFSTTWGTLAQNNAFATGTGTFTAAVPMNMPQDATMVGSAAGYNPGFGGDHQVLVVGVFPNGKVLAAAISAVKEVFAPGQDVPYDWQRGLAIALDVTDPNKVVQLGFFGEGTLHFDEASDAPGAPVKGSFDADLLNFPFQ